MATPYERRQASTLSGGPAALHHPIRATADWAGADWAGADWARDLDVGLVRRVQPFVDERVDIIGRGEADLVRHGALAEVLDRLEPTVRGLVARQPQTQ